MARGQRAPFPPATGCGEHCKLPQRGSWRIPDQKYILDALRAQKTRLVAANVVFIVVNRRMLNHMRNFQAAEKKRGYSSWWCTGTRGAFPLYATVCHAVKILSHRSSEKYKSNSRVSKVSRGDCEILSKLSTSIRTM